MGLGSGRRCSTATEADDRLTAVNVEPEGRWQTYVMHCDEDLADHWAQRLEEGATVCLVMGIGFDPRMCLGLEMLTPLASPDSLSIKLIEYGSETDDLAEQSAIETKALFESLAAPFESETLTLVSGGGLEKLARDSANLFQDLDGFSASDIVVDVNALPRSLFFPLISKLLYLCDGLGEDSPNLHVFAGNAAWLDALIEVDGVDENAVWLHPFAGTFLSEADDFLPRVWMPVLGEGDTQALRRISELVAPQEVCPLLPFPSVDPRRGDRLFESYREILFDELRADSGTVIYGDEGNPFQVYRRLRQSTIGYTESLAPLGGCKVAYSALSSKVVALGVLLAAFEFMGSEDHETGVAEIGAQRHRLTQAVSIAEAREDTELVGLSVSGDCYL